LSRAESYHKMLHAAAQFQKNIAIILEAKSVEAVRSSEWICRHLASEHIGGHSEQVKRSVEVHEQLLEVIEGLTKMEQALAKNLQVLLGQNQDNTTDSVGDSGDYGSMFQFGGNSR
jgi:hypothetical protein